MNLSMLIVGELASQLQEGSDCELPCIAELAVVLIAAPTESSWSQLDCSLLQEPATEAMCRTGHELVGAW